MYNWSRPARRGAFLGVLLTSLVVATCAATTFQLGSSPETPAAEGTVRLRQTSNGNTKINLAVKHLAPPARIDPASSVIVVWVRGLEAGAQPQNLGALRVNKNLSGKLEAVTSLSAFDFFLTCEGTQTVTAPTSIELLKLHYSGK